MGFDVHTIFGGGRSRKKGKKAEEPRPAARHASDPWEERPVAVVEPAARSLSAAPMRAFVDRENAAEVSDQIHDLLYTSFASFQHLMTQNITKAREVSSGPGVNINIDIDL